MAPMGGARSAIVSSGGPAIPDSGDHQWWVDEGSGNTLNDSQTVGTKVAATITDPTWVSDSAAVGGWKFDHGGGSGAYWHTDQAVLDSPFTICGWVNFDDMSGFSNGIASDGGTGGDRFYVDSDADGELLTVTGASSRIRGHSFPTTGNWGFFALHMESNQHRLVTYSNIQKLADSTNNNGLSYTGADLRVGWTDDGGYLDGQTDFYVVSSSGLLSDTEVKNLWQATKR